MSNNLIQNAMQKFRVNDIVVLANASNRDSKPEVGIITHVLEYNDNPFYSVTCYDVKVGDREFYCIPEDSSEFTEAMLDSIMPNCDYEIREATTDDIIGYISEYVNDYPKNTTNGSVYYTTKENGVQNNGVDICINVNLWGKLVSIVPDRLITDNLMRLFVKRAVQLGVFHTLDKEQKLRHKYLSN